MGDLRNKVIVTMQDSRWEEMLAGRKMLYIAPSAPERLYDDARHTCYVWVPEFSSVAGYFIADSAMWFSGQDLQSELPLQSILCAGRLSAEELKETCAPSGGCACWRVRACREEVKDFPDLPLSGTDAPAWAYLPEYGHRQQ